VNETHENNRELIRWLAIEMRKQEHNKCL